MGLGTFSGSGLGFGVSFTLQDQFSGVANRIQNSMDDLSSRTDKIADRINASFGKITAGVGLVATGIGLLSPIMKAMDIRQEFENYEIQLTTLLKSGEKARQLLADVKKDALDNPVFATKSLMFANTSLIATGNVDEKRSRNLVNNLSNALAGAGRGDEELNRMAINLQEIGNNGKAASRDLKQFAAAGLPIYKMIADATGKTTDQVKDMDVSLEVLEKTFEYAAGPAGMFHGAIERAGKGLMGLKAQAEENITFTFLEIAKVFEPIYKKFLKMVNVILEKFQDFVQTKAGKVVIAVVGIGLALMALGVIIVGLQMIFSALAGAVWAALAPMIPVVLGIALLAAKIYILYKLLNPTNSLLFGLGVALMFAFGPIGVAAGLVIMLVRAWKDFNAVMEGTQKPASGILGFFQKIGGIMHGVIELFKAANSNGFTMSEGLAKALDKVGVLDIVVSLGTWIVRIKELFKGIKQGLSEVWEGVKKFGKSILDQFQPILEKAGVWDDFIGKNKSSLEKWRDIGVKVGYAIAAVLGIIIIAIGIMTIAWIANAIATIIAWLPVIAVIVLIIAIIWAVIWVVNHWGEIMDAVSEWVVGAWNWVKEKVGQFFDWMFSLPAKMFNAGVEFVKNLWDGIKSIWDSLTNWVSDKVNALFEKISAPFKWIGDKMGQAYDWATGNDGNDPIKPDNPSLNPAPIGTGMATYGANQWGASQPTIFNTTTEKVASIHLTTELDGEKIYEKTLDRQRLNEARQG